MWIVELFFKVKLVGEDVVLEIFIINVLMVLECIFFSLDIYFEFFFKFLEVDYFKIILFYVINERIGILN